MDIDKSLLRDQATGNLLTQSLFLECGYGPKAIYTLKDEDYEYKGKTYYSLKRLYLEAEDVTEYMFATKYFYNWNQWQRIAANKLVEDTIEGWRFELELKLRARALGQMQDSAKDGNVSAQKFMADKGWDKKVGRPSKETIKKERKIEAGIVKQFDRDFKRVTGA